MQNVSKVYLLAIGVAVAALSTAGRSVNAAGVVSLTNATLFRTDATGSNLGTVSGQAGHGAWTTVLDQQNVSGNFGGELFLTQAAAPSASDFLTPLASPNLPLSLGTNTFFFYGDGDDTLGGSAGFGINLFLSSAAATSPSISAFAAPGAGQPLVTDSSLSTVGYNFQIIKGVNALSFTSGNFLVALTSYQITAVSGVNSNVDLVNSTNTSAFTPPPHPDGIMDTFGQFTLTVTSVPEPMSAAVLGISSLALLLRRRGRGVRATA